MKCKSPAVSSIVVITYIVMASASALGMEKRGYTDIDIETVKKWSAPYRGWHYYPEHVISARPNIKGFEKIYMTDVSTVFQLPGDDKWYMSFIGFDGRGYQSFIAESNDLVHWSNICLAMGFGPEGSFDHGGVVLGGYLLRDYDVKAQRILKKHRGKYWSLYGAYPRQGGYELRPGYEGVASSEDGLTWQRAKDEPILSVHQPDCGDWEKDCIYQPWLLEHDGKYFNFYNAAKVKNEQMGLALSDNILDWKRYENNPIIPNGPKGSYNEKFSSDGKVFRDEDHWIMFFYCAGSRGVHIMTAFSRDLYRWTIDPEPIYKRGGNPSGLDKKYACKISLVYNQKNETYYMFYTAAGDDGFGIGLITSKPISQKQRPEMLKVAAVQISGYDKTDVPREGYDPSGKKAFCGFRRALDAHTEFATYVHCTKCAGQFSGNVHKATVHTFKDQRIAMDNIAWSPAKDKASPWDYEWIHFIDSIRSDKPHNECKRAVYSDFATLMGRAAAHANSIVTWDQVYNSNFQFCDYLDTINENSPPPVTTDENGFFPAPVAGKWKEI